ncbi:glycoside hydrolase superfamily [Cokeromyces recurvatus]|uniref:glycoside hydrolase superfamily n=1 Tax=Cokeromyces recurvatus TaxID=90255 RepID=UPI00221FE15E|nr:glycoside hydrolase superfamily [Cokeromyces recurvatus]KAI7901892.1 glycoside hydrolase superfamily [Cokeromyces recurvatus]
MSNMAPLFSLFAIIPVILGGFYFYAHQRTYGNLDITTSSVAYNRTQYHDLLDWDKYALSIEGIPTLIHSGEFHYWRIPDRERWSPILKQYRAAGYNTIRIYFHWGYHSPDEGIYHFDGNRDIEYLLNLCEELNLFVLAAPGPYICAETQGGGYPSWLVAKRELNIRHNYIMLWRKYDPLFADYEVQWLNQILPIIARHQITENKNGKKGCVLGLQIDNELFETMANLLPIGLHDQMRVLAKAARDAGITVPLFTNDGFEEGGWVPRSSLINQKEKKKFWSKDKFGIDLYGFDKYVIFAPTSSPKSWLINSGVSVASWDEWNPKNLENSMDKLEKKVRGFGGGAKESPMFIPELQGGWFNHYQLQHTYDQIYDYYGDEYTKLILETAFAQGVTMSSIYMIYGGTNWGTIGDPDVYTSYDYSACIREFGMLSGRGRNVRKSLLLTRSFDPYFTKTERVSHPNVKSSIPHTLNLQRYSVGGDQEVTFTFFRNLDRKKRETFDVTIEEKGDTLTMGCYLPYKTSFIAVGNYTSQNDLHLIMSTIPILTRIVNKESNEEVWIVEPNVIGAMAFRTKEVKVTGNMQDDALRTDGPAIILTFEKDHGWTKIETVSGNLYIVGLSKSDASTLFAEFEEPYWNNGIKKYPAFVAWGADHFFYNKKKQALEINHKRFERTIHILSFEPIVDNRAIVSSDSFNLPFIYTLTYPNAPHISTAIKPTHWEYRTVDFKNLPWNDVKRLEGNASVTFDALDYHYTSGHILYRAKFQTPNKEDPEVILSLNARNRATVVVNGHIVGGHTTYSRQLFMPGAKIGPDPYFLGSHKYNLSPFLSHTSSLENELIILVESFGLNRQAFIMNDIRNPRGIINAKLKGLENDSISWEITGVDVRTLSIPYSSTGFPDENKVSGWKTYKNIECNDAIECTLPITVAMGVQWFRFRFDNELKKSVSSYHVPLRLHLDGEWTAMVFVNDVFIARYYGNGDGPQHDFYLPDNLIRTKNNEVKILAYTWKDTEGKLLIAGWPVLADSGNLITHETNGKPAEYVIYKDQITL